MSVKKHRITLGALVIVGAIAWFAVSGYQEGKAYYKTIEELHAMGPAADGKRLRVGGIVAEGSVVRDGREVTFTLAQDTLGLRVHYVSADPVPDTFKGGVEAIVEGVRTGQGTFEADHIQAKCASKYEAQYTSGNTQEHVGH